MEASDKYKNYYIVMLLHCKKDERHLMSFHCTVHHNDHQQKIIDKTLTSDRYSNDAYSKRCSALLPEC